MFDDSYELVSGENVGDLYRDCILTVRVMPGSFWRWFGYKPTTAKFVGNSTVWSTYPGFSRCDTSLQLILCQLQDQAEFDLRHPGKRKGG